MTEPSLITSTQNPLIKQAVALRESKERKKTGLTLIDGVRELNRALEAGINLQKVFMCPKLLPAGLNRKELKGIEIIEVSGPVFEKLSYGQRLDGVIAIAHVKSLNLADLKLSKNPLLMVIESIEKPGNLGAILRTCDGAGVEAVLVCDEATDIYNPNVIRASTGVVFRIPVIAASKEHVLDFLTKNKIKTIGTFPQAKDIYTQADFKNPTAIILGAEDQGLSPFWTKNCTTKVKIPMNGIADSLNVSVTAAIITYEALRQRTAKVQIK